MIYVIQSKFLNGFDYFAVCIDTGASRYKYIYLYCIYMYKFMYSFEASALSKAFLVCVIHAWVILVLCSLGNTAIILHVGIYSLIEILCTYPLSLNSGSIGILPNLVSVTNYSVSTMLFTSNFVMQFSLTGNKVSAAASRSDPIRNHYSTRYFFLNVFSSTLIIQWTFLRNALKILCNCLVNESTWNLRISLLIL